MRRRTNRRLDRKMFRKYANTGKMLNVMYPRGGIRL